MKRSPIVLAGTAAGLVAVIGYHVSGPKPLLLSTASASGTTSSGGGSASGGSGGGSGSGGGAGAATKSSPSAAAKSSGAGATASTKPASSSGATSSAPVTPAVTRSAVGKDVQYPFGDLQVKVTMVGPRISAVSLVRANVLDAQSGAIDQIALPELRTQALSVQSAQINGVSGATYTSAAYQQSLQSAIDRLKA